MNKATRIATAIIVSLVIGGINAHNDSVNLTPGYQAHPFVTIIANFFWAGLVAGSIIYFGSGWLAKRKERNVNKVHNLSGNNGHSGKVDEKIYDEVARELQEKPIIPGLWTKAFAEMDGDDAKARALYIKYRAAQLMDASRQQQKEDGPQKKWREQQHRSAIESAKRQARSKLHRLFYALLTLVCGLLTLSFGIFGLGPIVMLFTEDPNSRDSDSIILAIIFGLFLLIFAFFFGLATKHCYKETL